MKKIFYTTIIAMSVLFSCKEEEDLIKNQPLASIYPDIAATAVEEDGKTYTIYVETTQELTSEGSVVFEIENGQFITTTPTKTGDLVTLTIPAGESMAQLSIVAGDDNFGTDYEATFRISSVSGGIRGIGLNTFTFFVTDNDQLPVVQDDFESGNLSNWTIFDVDGSNSWEVREFSGNSYAIISNFNNTGNPAESWLISPAVDFENLEAESVTFLSQTAFNDDNILDVYVLSEYTSGNPSSLIVKTLNPTLDPHRGGGFGDFTSSGRIDLSDITGVGHVAFRYKATSTSDGSQWQIDDFLLSASDPNGTIGGGDQRFSIPFIDDLNTCGDFSVPSNFIQEKIPGSKTDRGWYCDGNGNAGSQGLKAFATGGSTGAINAWLISAKPFDLRAVSSANMSFDVKVNTSGNGTLNVLWSSDYSGAGDPTVANWTNAGAVTMPAQSTSFSEIVTDLSEAAGEVVYVALQFTDATNTNSVDFNLDNIAIDDNAPLGPSLLSENFDDCSALNSFSQFSVIGDQIWDCTTFGQDGTTAAQISGFSGSALDNEDWMISPVFTPSATSQLIFDARTRFGGLPIEVKVSSNYSGTGDPSSATWTDLTVGLPAIDSDVWTTVDPVSLASFAGQNIYIAFVYYSNPSDGAPRWTIDNLTVSE